MWISGYRVVEWEDLKIEAENQILKSNNMFYDKLSMQYIFGQQFSVIVQIERGLATKL